MRNRTIILACLLTALLLPGADAHAQSAAAHQQFVFAYRLLQRGDDKLAAEAFDEFLGKFPADDKAGDALYYRAMLARKLGDSQAAARLLAQTPKTTVVPGYAPAVLRGQVLIDTQQYPQALAALEPINPNELEVAVRASVLFLRGSAYTGAGNLPAAAQQFEAVTRLDSPLRSQAMLELARTLANLEQFPAAVEAFNRVIALKEPATAAEAARLAGDLLYRQRQYDKAIDSYRLVLTEHQTSPHFGPAVVGTMWAQFSANRHTALLSAFDVYKGSLTAEDRVTAWYLAASAHQERGEHDKAVELFNAMLPTAGGSGLLDKALFKLASSCFELGRFDAMSAALARLRTEVPASPLLADAELLSAAADARQGKLAAGAARLTTIINAGAQHPAHARALLQRGRMLEAAQQYAPAAADYQRYLQVPGVELASASARDALLRLVDIQIRLDQLDDAERNAMTLLSGSPEPLTEQEALYRLTLVRVKAKKLSAALETVQQLLSRHPQNKYLAESRYYRGLLLMSTGKPDEALVDLTAAAEAEALPNDLRVASLRLASLRQREKGLGDEAAASLLQLEKMVGLTQLSPAEQLWMGKHLTDKGDAKAALRYLQPILAANPLSMSGRDRAEAMHLAASCLHRIGDNDSAIVALRQVIAVGFGLELQARLDLARILASTGKTDEALAEYEGLFSADASRVAASALVGAADLHRQRARRAKLAGNTLAAAEELEQALKALKRVTLLYAFPELSPLPEHAYLDLVEVEEELKKGDPGATLDELMVKFPNTPFASYAKAIIAERSGLRGDAVFLLKKVVEQGQSVDARLAVRAADRLKRLEGQP